MCCGGTQGQWGRKPGTNSKNPVGCQQKSILLVSSASDQIISSFLIGSDSGGTKLGVNEEWTDRACQAIHFNTMEAGISKVN